MTTLAELLIDEDTVGLPIDPFAPGGLVDMYEAALADPDPATALARLRGHGFVTGALRSWTDGVGIAQVTLHKFGSRRDAELASLEQAHGIIASAGVAFDVDLGEPASFGASIEDLTHQADTPFVAHVVIRPVGNIMMLVLLGGPAFGPRDAVRLAGEQSARLIDA